MSLGLSARVALAVADLLYRRPLLAAARDPRQIQERTLRRMLSDNADTEFGRTHGFADLTSCDAYRAAVPVQTHDSLREAIQRQADTGAPALTMAPPVFYARTSGTTGPARDFPVTVQGQVAQRVAQRVFAATLRRGADPNRMGGTFLPVWLRFCHPNCSGEPPARPYVASSQEPMHHPGEVLQKDGTDISACSNQNPPFEKPPGPRPKPRRLWRRVFLICSSSSCCSRVRIL